MHVVNCGKAKGAIKHGCFQFNLISIGDNMSNTSDQESYQINVHFRAFPEGDIIALWDEDSSYKFISSYMRVGQHSEASRDLIHELKPAKEEEYKSLLNELESIGYAVVIL